MKWFCPVFVSVLVVSVCAALMKMVNEQGERVDSLQKSMEELAVLVDKGALTIVSVRDEVRRIKSDQAKTVALVESQGVDPARVLAKGALESNSVYAEEVKGNEEVPSTFGFISTSELTPEEAEQHADASFLFRCENGALAAVRIPGELSPVAREIARDWMLTRLDLVIAREELFREAVLRGEGERFTDYNAAFAKAMGKRPKLEWVLRKLEEREEWALIKIEDPDFLRLVANDGQLKADLEGHGVSLRGWKTQFPVTDQ